MEAEIEVLNFIYQNGQMGVNTISQLLKDVKEQQLHKHLEKQYQGYLEFYEDAKMMLHERGYDEEGISLFAKVRTYLMVNMELTRDNSSRGIAKMLMIGSNMGIISSIENLHRYSTLSKEVELLLERLQHFEENSLNSLKMFL